MNKIEKAKAKLLLKHPYFGMLASKVDVVIDDNLQSFKSDGKKVYIREEYLNDLTLDEVEFILANSAMHKVLAHENRKNNRSGWLWRMATDIAINDMLIDNGFTLPYGAEYRKRFKGMYAEEIYEELKSDILRDDLEYEADSEDDIEKNNNQKEQNEPQNTDEEILQEVLDANEAIELLEKKLSKHEIPKSIERFFKTDNNPKINWQQELQNTVFKFAKDDFSFFPPNLKYLHNDIYLPSVTSDKLKFVIAIDSSASIDDELLNMFLTEVNFILNSLKNYEIDLIVCDDKVHTHKKFYSGDILEISIKGYGATDFRPVFEFIDENLENINLLLYFTDLKGFFPKNEPLYEVKWVTDNLEATPPFGELIMIK